VAQRRLRDGSHSHLKALANAIPATFVYTCVGAERSGLLDEGLRILHRLKPSETELEGADPLGGDVYEGCFRLASIHSRRAMTFCS
jgi:hypothetical protein